MNALNAYNALNANVSGLKKASEKLSSGYRINRAGDDAAGLAISEKMRSQLKGLNQAIRNSQDGINMVQTFEGAAQETHSILQRMKELAVESASGTYDNATDRAAIQLEFDQLNDELNQIADTDFNGTIVLNGGVMADGTVAKNGEFNYANGYTELAVANKAVDISGNVENHAIVDQTLYNKTTADAVWNAVGVDVNDHEKIQVTFMFDGERWVADTVTDKNNNVIDGARAAGLTAKEITDVDGNTGEGGFMVVAGKDENGVDIDVAEAIFDEMKIAGVDGTRPVQKGDTVTIEFNNSKALTYAPQNAGIKEDSIETPDLAAGQTFTAGEVRGNLGFKLDASITDGNMNSTMQKILDDVKTLKFTATYAAGTVADKSTDIAIDDDDASGDYTFTLDADGVLTAADGDGNKVTVGTITANDFKGHTDAQPEKWGTAAASNATGFDVGDEDDLKAKILAELTNKGNDADDYGDTDVTITLTDTTNGAGKAELSFTYKDAAGADQTQTVEILEANFGDWGINYSRADATANTDTIKIKYTAATSENDALDSTQAGTVDFKLDLAAYNYADMDELAIHGVKTPDVATMKTQVTADGVTNANAFKNSTARMTYTDNITLQTGARTKDAVNFNFSYNTDGTADMGSLLANLDLSSRSTGLNTANLSLANADDANYAIDQIDKAINKTSMVRATFGSIQNRLEHKITNLTTTAENLTEAESSIRDTDMASEMMNYTKFNILQQAAQSMLAQANQQPQSILQLLG